MRFLADESVEAPVVLRLREEGHDVLAIAEDRPGADDPTVLEQATGANRILVTNDKDFAELAFLQRQVSTGIVLLRLSRLRSGAKARRLIEVAEHQQRKLHGAMTVIEEGAFRRRPLPRVRRRRPPHRR